MAQQDIFNYDVDVKTKQIVASRNVAVDFGNGKVALVQTVRGGYGHRVEPVYESGSSSVYFVNGHPMGTLEIMTIVGKDGWFANILDNNNGTCAEIKTINLDLVSENECDVDITMNTNLKLESCIIREIGFQVTAADLSITNSASFICGKIMRSN